MCGRSYVVDFRDALRIIGVGVKAAHDPVLSLLQVGYRERLYAETWRQVFESWDVLVHDLVGAQPPFSHSVLLEGLYKVCKHPADPQFCQEVVIINEFGERLWNAAYEARKNKIIMATVRFAEALVIQGGNWIITVVEKSYLIMMTQIHMYCQNIPGYRDILLHILPNIFQNMQLQTSFLFLLVPCDEMLLNVLLPE